MKYNGPPPPSPYPFWSSTPPTPPSPSLPCHSYPLTQSVASKGVGSLIEVKIADFGLSALVRIGEDGYDVEESSKRKKYKGLTEVTITSISKAVYHIFKPIRHVSFTVDFFKLWNCPRLNPSSTILLSVALYVRCGVQKNILHLSWLTRLMARRLISGPWAASSSKCFVVTKVGSCMSQMIVRKELAINQQIESKKIKKRKRSSAHTEYIGRRTLL